MKVGEGSARRARPALRGAAERVIRVREPVPGLFREAVFFLQEDLLRRPPPGREELLRQARAAAEDYLRPFYPPRRGLPRWLIPAAPALGFLLGLAAGYGLFS